MIFTNRLLCLIQSVYVLVMGHNQLCNALRDPTIMTWAHEKEM